MWRLLVAWRTVEMLPPMVVEKLPLLMVVASVCEMVGMDWLALGVESTVP
jgi:hypothetical protein